MQTHMLIQHRAIQEWVTTRRGRPGISRVPDREGEIRSHLTLNFDADMPPIDMPRQDQGISPCSWSAWLAELDRQQLALKVSDKETPDFELVARRELN